MTTSARANVGIGPYQCFRLGKRMMILSEHRGLKDLPCYYRKILRRLRLLMMTGLKDTDLFLDNVCVDNLSVISGMVIGVDIQGVIRVVGRRLRVGHTFGVLLLFVNDLAF